MENNLSSYRRGKIILGLINDLKNIENKDHIYVSNDYGEPMIEKIAERAGFQNTDWRECGFVDISEDISVALDNRIDDYQRKMEGEDKRSPQFGGFDESVFEVGDELREAVDEFEKKMIPSSGTCNTLLGEIFRAIQRIQYRAHNDGDLCWDPGSPSFMSYVYLRSQIDLLNYSSHASTYDGMYGFEFTNEFLKEREYDGKISDMIEDQYAMTANFIKYQLMDLIMNGKIEDSENEYDSRDYSSIKTNSYY